ncbi:MAG: hypothetical protein ABI579_08520, partial [Candidatus Sumerlaeota bacterium]
MRIFLAREGAPTPPAAKPATFGKNFLILINGSEHGHDGALEFIQTLSNNNNVKIVASPCYAERHGQDALVAAAGSRDVVHTKPDLKLREKFVDDAEAVIYLLPVRTAISKLANAMSDDPTTSMITRAMLRGVPTFAAGGDCDPAKWPKTLPAPMKQGRGSYTEMLNEGLDRLAGWGLVYRADPAQILPLLPGGEIIAGDSKPVVESPKTAVRCFLTT